MKRCKHDTVRPPSGSCLRFTLWDGPRNGRAPGSVWNQRQKKWWKSCTDRGSGGWGRTAGQRSQSFWSAVTHSKLDWNNVTARTELQRVDFVWISFYLTFISLCRIYSSSLLGFFFFCTKEQHNMDEIDWLVLEPLRDEFRERIERFFFSAPNLTGTILPYYLFLWKRIPKPTVRLLSTLTENSEVLKFPTVDFEKDFSNLTWRSGCHSCFLSNILDYTRAIPIREALNNVSNFYWICISVRNSPCVSR